MKEIGNFFFFFFRISKVRKGEYATILSSIGDIDFRLGLFESAMKNYSEVSENDWNFYL